MPQTGLLHYPVNSHIADYSDATCVNYLVLKVWNPLCNVNICLQRDNTGLNSHSLSVVGYKVKSSKVSYYFFVLLFNGPFFQKTYRPCTTNWHAALLEFT